MARKIGVEFVVQGKVEASLSLASLPDTRPRRGARKKKLALDPEDYDMGEEMDKKRTGSDDESSMSLLKKNLNEINSESESASKRSTRGKRGGKKKVEEEEEEDAFPAPKSKPSRAPRGGGGSTARKGGRASGKKGKDLSPKEDVDSVVSSNKNGEDSPSNLDNDLELEEEDMKLEDDDEELEDDEMDDEDTFNGLNALSTKNVLKLARMQQEDASGANSDKNSVTDISSLNIDLSKLTRRQKNQLKNQANLNIDVEEPLMELPDKKPRKKKDNLTEEQQIKKMESANKRKLLNQKLQEEQKKQTINKILNEAGRKQKQRKEKEDKDQEGKENRQFRTLPEGEVGIKFVSKANETFLVLPEDYPVQNLLIDPTY